MDALTPVGRLFGPWGHEHRSVPQRVSLLLSSTLPTVLSPTTPPPPSRHFCSSTVFFWSEGQTRRPCVPRNTEGHFPPGFGSGLRTALAGSPVGLAESGSLCAMFLMSRRYGPVVHLRLLPTPCRHDAVAFDCRRVNVPPDRDFHPAVSTPSQAHECGAAAPLWNSRHRIRGPGRDDALANARGFQSAGAPAHSTTWRTHNARRRSLSVLEAPSSRVVRDYGVPWRRSRPQTLQ
jgi:hypothetical protein